MSGVPSMKRSDGAVHGEDAMQGTVEDSPLIGFSSDRGAHNPLTREGSHTSHRPSPLMALRFEDSEEPQASGEIDLVLPLCCV